ncbi:MAG: potassium channel family protein [Gaiellaceae bacterium]|nr:potassium channel family protein [Gaiellaceae bacterium]
METDRVEAFSDGVFAIAITLLILSVGIEQAPHGDLGTYLVDLWPAYAAYAVSFLTIGIMWVNHHLLFDNFARVDRPMLLLNIFLLMLIAFVPFPTHIVAEFARSEIDRRNAALLYGLTMTATAILFFALWMYGSRRLLRANADPRVVSGITRSYLPGAPLYASATLLAFLSSIASLVMFAAIALFYALSAALFGRTEATVARTASSGDAS